MSEVPHYEGTGVWGHNPVWDDRSDSTRGCIQRGRGSHKGTRRALKKVPLAAPLHTSLNTPPAHTSHAVSHSRDQSCGQPHSVTCQIV